MPRLASSSSLDFDMTLRLLAAFALLCAAPAAFAAGPGSTPDWASPSVAPSNDAPADAFGPAPPPPPPPPPVPVDGGLTLLALAGAGYATRKLRARNA